MKENLPFDIYASNSSSVSNIMKPGHIRCVIFLESNLYDDHFKNVLKGMGFINNEVSFQKNVQPDIKFEIYVGAPNLKPKLI